MSFICDEEETAIVAAGAVAAAEEISDCEEMLQLLDREVEEEVNLVE